MIDFPTLCLIAIGVGMLVAELRAALLRRRDEADRHAFPGRDAAAFGFTAGLLVLLVGGGWQLLAEYRGSIETIDRGRIAGVAIGFFVLVLVPYAWFFRPLYRVPGWEYRYGRLLNSFCPAMLFIGCLLGTDAVNRHWDHGVPVYDTMTVTAPPDRRGAGDASACRVEVSPSDGSFLRLGFERAACRTLTPGQTVTVPVRPGVFGARWVDSADLAGAP